MHKFWRIVCGLCLLQLVSTAACAQTVRPIVNRAEWWRNGATLDMDFLADRYYLNGTAYSNIAAFIAASSATFTRTRANAASTATPPFYLAGNQTFGTRASVTNNVTSTNPPFYADAGQTFVSRASSGTYFDIAGTMQTATTNTARVDYDPVTHALKGTLLEPAATNYIRNGALAGSTNGIIGSGGAVPTNWQAGGGVTPASLGLNAQLVGSGTEFGMTYVDIRYSGTPNASQTFGYYFEQTNVVVAAANQSWTASAYLRLVGGSMSNLTASYGVGERDSSGNTLVGTANNITPTATLQRFLVSRIFNNASTAYASMSLLFSVTNGAAIDITIRHYAPQLEKSSYATAYIPTSGSTATRAADVYNQQPATYYDSTGTLHSAAANAARVDYSPSTLVQNGTLIEAAATNLLTYSNDFSKFSASTNTTFTANSTTSPDGITNAQKLANITTASGQTFARTNYTFAPNTAYTISVYAKPAEYSYMGIQLFDGGTVNVYPYFNISTGTLSQADGATNYRIQALPNGWYRISLTVTTSSTATAGYVTILYQPVGTNSGYTGVVGSGVYFYGAQLEQSSYITSYVPTVASTVTRTADTFATTAYGSYINSSGAVTTTTADTPRLDYDPAGLYPKGVLIEEPRFNYWKYSSDFSNSAWLKNAGMSVTANATTAPDGTNTAQQINTTAGNLSAIWQYPYGTTSNVLDTLSRTFTYSVYAKANTTSKLVWDVYSGFTDAVGAATVNLSAGTVTASGVGATATILPVGNGWYRLTFTYTNSSYPYAIAYRTVMFIDNYGASSGGNLYLWGAQMEEGAFVTSYIPTTSTTMARAADSFKFPTTGWYDSTQGTMLADTYGQTNSRQPGYSRIVGIDPNLTLLCYNSGLNLINSFNGGVAAVKSLTFANSPTQSSRLGFTWDDASMTRSLTGQGLTPAASSYTGTYTSTNLHIGSNVAADAVYQNYDPLNASIRRVTYFPFRSSDAVLTDYTR